jgi:MFS family permease
MLYVVLPIYWREAGLTSLYEVGIILSVNRFIRLPLNPIVSWIYTRISIKTGLMLAVLFTGVVTFLYAEAQGFWFWFVLRCLWGVIWTFLRLGAFYALLDLSTDQNRGFLMGKYNGIYRLGSLFGMLIGGCFVGLAGMDTIFMLFAGLTIAALYLVHKYITTSSPHSTNTRARTGWKGAIHTTAGYLKIKQVWLVLASGLVISFIIQGMFNSTLSYILEKQLIVYGGGFLVSATVLSGLIQALRWTWEPWLAPWIGRKSDQSRTRVPILMVTLVACAIMFVLVPLPIPMIAWFSVLLIIQVAATLLTTIMDTIASDLSTQFADRAAVITIYSMMLDLGSAIGPVLGYMFEIPVMYTAAAILFVMVAGCWMLVPRSKNHMVH